MGSSLAEAIALFSTNFQEVTSLGGRFLLGKGRMLAVGCH